MSFTLIFKFHNYIQFIIVFHMAKRYVRKKKRFTKKRFKARRKVSRRRSYYDGQVKVKMSMNLTINSGGAVGGEEVS